MTIVIIMRPELTSSPFERTSFWEQQFFFFFCKECHFETWKLEVLVWVSLRQRPLKSVHIETCPEGDRLWRRVIAVHLKNSKKNRAAKKTRSRTCLRGSWLEGLGESSSSMPQERLVQWGCQDSASSAHFSRTKKYFRWKEKKKARRRYNGINTETNLSPALASPGLCFSALGSFSQE